MKQALLSLSVIVLIFSYVQIGKGKEDNLIYIVNSLEKLNADINEWSIYYKYDDRYVDSLGTFRKQEAKLKNKYPNFKWEEEKVKDHHILITGNATGNKFSEQILLTALKEGNRYKVLHTYSYTGENWSKDKYLKLTKTLDNRNNLYFTVKSKMLPSEHQNLGKTANILLDKLLAKPVEQLTEEDFVAVSAYKNSWENSLQTKNNEKMNLQVGLRKKTDEKLISLTIGNPIITVEY
ncbi:YwmB family TATA-box binding protein [Cytobacillus sp. FSL W8-0315]|uniref:YwmB family TATA-box binding protein n=1 Tax=Cytobacillus sp. FSL W8-0315 TaxID=2921600 RepID=UPI0030F6D759